MSLSAQVSPLVICTDPSSRKKVSECLASGNSEETSNSGVNSVGLGVFK